MRNRTINCQIILFLTGTRYPAMASFRSYVLTLTRGTLGMRVALGESYVPLSREGDGVRAKILILYSRNVTLFFTLICL